jgi:hypothetical protein
MKFLGQYAQEIGFVLLKRGRSRAARASDEFATLSAELSFAAASAAARRDTAFLRARFIGGSLFLRQRVPVMSEGPAGTGKPAFDWDSIFRRNAGSP